MSWWQDETAGLYNWAWVVIAVAIVVVIAVVIIIAAVSHSRRKKQRAAEAQDEAVKVFEEEEDELEAEAVAEIAPEVENKTEEDETVAKKNRQFEAELHEPHIQFDVKLSEGLDAVFVVCKTDSDWAVATSGSKRVLKLFYDAESALSFAKKLAAIYKGSAVFVGEDGRRTQYKFVGKY